MCIRDRPDGETRDTDQHRQLEPGHQSRQFPYAIYPADGTPPERLDSVSYTHLDVYKRQCLSWGIYRLLRTISFLYAFYPLIYLICVSLVYIPLTFYYEHKRPKEYKHLKVVLRLACFNTAVIGAALIAVQGILTFTHVLGFAVGSAIGFSIALFLVEEGQRVLSLRQIPKAFRGLPITLLYIGILSLAFYGLIGHQLPV